MNSKADNEEMDPPEVGPDSNDRPEGEPESNDDGNEANVDNTSTEDIEAGSEMKPGTEPGTEPANESEVDTTITQDVETEPVAAPVVDSINSPDVKSMKKEDAQDVEKDLEAKQVEKTPSLFSSGKFWIPVLSITTVIFLITTIVLALSRNNSGSDNGAKGPSTDTVVAGPPEGDNPCHDAKPKLEIFDNKKCVVDGVVAALEQAGGNVTIGYKGDLNTGGREPITTAYFEAGLCPVNVHWHLGTEHLSVGEYDDNGKGPSNIHRRRRLAGKTRLGHQCSLYDKDDSRFTTEYEWKHCTDMEVGQTYEVHWPHSAAGACGTVNQYQTPFYDGVFCKPDIITLAPLNTFQKIGVQAQVFTIINDDSYYYPDLMRGMIVDGEMGSEITKYTGSTTGTSRNNNMCSSWTPITWQVDRKCHLISASSFDKMCADMKAQRDDMTDDLYPHGSREVVSDHLAADNHQNLRSRHL